MKNFLRLQVAVVIIIPICYASDLILGKTISETIQSEGVMLESASIITEPPAVARGLSFEIDNGHFQIFIERGQVPLTFEGGSNLELYKKLKVIGIRFEKYGKTECVGEVLWHYSCAAPNKTINAEQKSIEH